MRSLLLLTLVLAPLGVRGQGIPPEELPPGTGFAWEPVGDRGVSAHDLQFTSDHALWTAGVRLFRLDPATQTWAQLSINHREAVLVLSASTTPDDTLFVSDQGGVYRSFDRGQTFTEVEPSGGDVLAETAAGALLVGGDDAPYVRRSADRGQTWAPAAFTPPGQPSVTEAFLALPPTADAPGGRVLAGNGSGVAASDDDGATFHATGLWGGGAAILEFALVGRPGGGRRAIAGGLRAAMPYGRAWYSDDEGATWAGEATFPDVEDGGVSYQAVKAVVGIGGTSACLILGRGAVYRTDDGGASWALVGRTPMFEREYVGDALLGPDGRLYVGLVRLGASTPVEGWVYRTAEPVTVASEGGAEAAQGLLLSAVPNPSSGDTSLVLTLGEASSSVRVTLYDALGREAATVHDGPLAAGTHRLAVDTSALAPGVYVACVVTEGGTVSARLTLAR
jgi:photosystem II stability/assembly factor-like uncharacterized protein